MKELKTIEEYRVVLRESDDVLMLMKHSNSCATSLSAYQEVKKLSKKIKMHIYYCVVQDSRRLSDYIEQKMNVKHESPQVLIIRNRKVLKYFSHGEIDQDKLFKSIMKY